MTMNDEVRSGDQIKFTEFLTFLPRISLLSGLASDWFWSRWSLSRDTGLKVMSLHAFLSGNSTIGQQWEGSGAETFNILSRLSGLWLCDQSWDQGSTDNQQTERRKTDNRAVWHVTRVWESSETEYHCHGERDTHRDTKSSVAKRTWRGHHDTGSLPPHHRHSCILSCGSETASAERMCGGQHWHLQIWVTQGDDRQVHEDTEKLPPHRQGEALH